MSSFGRYGFFAACGVLLIVLLDVFVARGLDPDSRLVFLSIIRIGLYALAAALAATAAAKFGWWSEHIGRAWTLFSVEFLLLLINYILRRTLPEASSALGVTLIGANLAQIAAYWLMARSLHAAGIGYMMSRSRKILLTVVALAVAVVLCHASLRDQWEAIQAGTASAGSVISSLSDVITFTLVAPLAMSTLALRGGQVSWIFGFLTVSVLGWMVNEGGGSLVQYLGGSEHVLRTVRTTGVAIAALFNAAASTTQVVAANRAMKGSDHA